MGRRPRLNPVAAAARNRVEDALADVLLPAGAPSGAAPAEGEAAPLVLVACSGGPDSLALAAAAVYFAKAGRCRVGAVVVDHGLQEDSAAVARHAADQLAGLGLSPVEVRTVEVAATGMGPEAAARTARYAALDAAARGSGAAAVLLGHTLDDQAEQVLLGLARGSGTRSLAGMPARRGPYRRPFLDLRRADTEEICSFYGLDPWRDPSNADPAFARSRVRTQVLPYLEEQLGPGIAQALYRSARILGQDADYLEQLSSEAYAGLRTEAGGDILLPEEGLRGLPASLRQRVLALAAVEVGGFQPSFERLLAAETLLERRGSAGPVQLGGRVGVYRQVRGKSVLPGGPSYGNLVFRNNRPGTEPPSRSTQE
ncbi:tRNA lysidine(34) synthetase TilS [Arthrobacter zhaoguopingii]|uniref:tRNA lysidine(34) synthetase TilS n=1 Tax=Arthrobacter zhaoguopingii TaxID=2681491 RepID=UPI00135BC7EF|nr:tRNA lysidine(34) synthetase TilS [Arthrobacter zhaoguopingii]